MWRSCCTALAALAVVALAAPVRADDDKDARALFDKMEKALTGAKTLQVEAKGKVDSDQAKLEVDARLLLAEGNKGRLEFAGSFGEKTFKFKSVSDGSKTKTINPKGEAQEKETPKTFHKNFVTIASRAGLASLIITGRKGGGKQPTAEALKVSDFKLGKREKIDKRDAQAVEYQLQPEGLQVTLGMTVWIDVKTNLPVRRSIETPFGSITENYTIRVNEKIDPKQFELTD